MLQKIPFVKMHGLGNDFVIIHQDHVSSNYDLQKTVQKICSRNIGIGCDQLILYNYDDDVVKIKIFNQDGSHAQACGNASRCITKLLYEQHDATKNLKLNIDGRIIYSKYLNAHTIIINMGVPLFDSVWMPNNTDLRNFAKRYMINPQKIMCVDVANPHLIIFSYVPETDYIIIAQALQASKLFPHGININFAQIKDNKIFLQVWERGVGLTQSCGSGAMATFAAANKLGFFANEVEVVFHLGSLNITKQKDNILIRGTANYVFSGEYFI